MNTLICQECNQEKRETLFSLIVSASNPSNDTGEEIREDVCRACRHDGATADQKHKIIREAYRHYLTFKQYVTDTGNDVIEYAIPKEAGSDEFVPVTISFSDLQRALTRFSDGARAEGTVLSKRKEQAFYLNVIRDMLQRDVAEIMGITTVSVGQYVEQAMLQLCAYYFEDVQDTTNVQETENE
jgi:hypothetical protein